MVEFKNSERGVGPVVAVANSAIVKAKLPKIEKFRKIVDPALAAGFQPRSSGFPNLFNGWVSL
ncbi:hypothetical protein [Rhizobium bangladeshense]|uniref:Uncharacterized protein n=1 Tax=Rhizobium bangladeshense TaxID=1138189 RepID=A0ABS7LHH4_9HYPH|nr:hypothetical protein [Rhizobium bangladeshense]MBX4872731.1 hypothetical protein [Rhizobium bangladeshense]MBX4884110.1 hypothetical protein [Rhizobium bangladeshense]MBX4913530.1 hypothetical protein [Rhizobium bangladeshense]MBY3590830.1 hypothetical protein [Rhizobium bangladeshense]MBY3597006.1 hypothetical protein [Rhizobium bangladeshense]